MFAPDREGLGLSNSALRGVDVDLRSPGLAAVTDNDVAVETVTAIGDDVDLAIAAIVAQYRW